MYIGSILLSDKEYFNEMSAQNNPKMHKNSNFIQRLTIENPKKLILNFLNINSVLKKLISL